MDRWNPRCPRSGQTQPREIVILGSTGSIGTQALDIVRRNPGRFRVVALAAGGGQPDVLASQAAEFGVAAVAVANPAAVPAVQDALRSVLSRTDPVPASANPPAPGFPPPSTRWPGRGQRGGRVAVRRGAQRRDRGGRAARHAGGAGRRPGAGPGQQGVADHRRPAGDQPGQAGADRARSTPNTPRSRSACGPGAIPRCAAWC